MIFIINSIPKSGTHLLASLFYRLNFINSNFYLMGSLCRKENKIIDYFYNFYNSLYSNQIVVDLDGLRGYPLHFLDKKLNKLISLKKNIIIISHIPFSYEFDFLLKNYNLKIITIYRDPRDCIVSYINYIDKNDRLRMHKVFKNISLHKKIDYILNGYKLDNNYQYLAPFEDRIQRVLNWKNSENNLFVKFENLIGTDGGSSDDLKIQELNKIQSFTNINIPKNIDYFGYNSETFFKGNMKQYLNLDKVIIEKLNLRLIDLLKAMNYV